MSSRPRTPSSPTAWPNCRSSSASSRRAWPCSTTSGEAGTGPNWGRRRLRPRIRPAPEGGRRPRPQTPGPASRILRPCRTRRRGRRTCSSRMSRTCRLRPPGRPGAGSLTNRELVTAAGVQRIGAGGERGRCGEQDCARDNGLELPDGMMKDGKRDRFNDRAKQENLGEKQQQERTGITKAGRMAEIAACWTATKTGPEFVRAMEDKGYYLARGDQRAYVVIDLYGEIHSLSRQLGGVAKKKELMDRLSAYPPDQQRDVESARAYASEKLQEREKALQKGQEAQEPSRSEAAAGIEKRSTALHERQASRRAELDAHRADLYARQFRERGALSEMQAAGKEGIASSRLERQPKGLAAFLTRITGIGNLVSWVQNKADARREAAHKQQTQTLLRHHDRELKEMDRHYLALHRLEVRENRSASTAAQREGYRKLRVRTFELKPEFEKALARQEGTGAAGGGGNRAVS